MALVRECDICGCEIASMTNGYYRCTKIVELSFSIPRTDKEEETKEDMLSAKKMKVEKYSNRLIFV